MSYYLIGSEFLLGVRKILWKCIEAAVAQQGELYNVYYIMALNCILKNSQSGASLVSQW